MALQEAQVHLRTATDEDIPQIHNLVRELAIFEDSEEQFLITEAYYLTEFRKGTFECVVAELNREIVGICVYYMTFSTWKGRMLYLEDFVVQAKSRNLGIGQKLFDRFIEISKEKDCKMVKWQVLDWNSNAVRFYVKNGATIEKEWWNAKIIY